MESSVYRIAVRGGKGADRFGIERDYGKWIMDGSILEHSPTDDYGFAVWDIYDEKGELVRRKDWGRNEGAVVYPDCVRVYFGKNETSGYVEVGYQRRKDGTFYGIVTERIPARATRQWRDYKATFLYKRIAELKKCPEWNSLCYGIHLPDETKAAYKAAIDEACSGRYRRIEFIRDEI